MNVSVTYDETDVARVLENIIQGPNASEFVKLLTPMICQSSNATKWFFKLIIGNKLPEIIPNGTLCKIQINNLGYSSNKVNIRNKYGDENSCVIVSVRDFMGYHEYSNYKIDFTNVDDNGNDSRDYTSVQADHLEVIEEI